MSTLFVDFAICPCGQQTAIQPTMTELPDVYREPLGTVADVILVACTKCKRVYRFDTAYLVSIPTSTGVGPYTPESPMHVFRVLIPCDELNCNFRLVVLVTLKPDTNDEQMKAEKATWWWIDGDLKCDRGHRQPCPPWH